MFAIIRAGIKFSSGPFGGGPPATLLVVIVKSHVFRVPRDSHLPAETPPTPRPLLPPSTLSYSFHKLNTFRHYKLSKLIWSFKNSCYSRNTSFIIPVFFHSNFFLWRGAPPRLSAGPSFGAFGNASRKSGTPRPVVRGPPGEPCSQAHTGFSLFPVPEKKREIFRFSDGHR